MKNCKDSIFLAALIIAIMGNALLFKFHFWKIDSIIEIIAIWLCATPLFSYCTFKFLMAIANGGKNEN